MDNKLSNITHIGTNFELTVQDIQEKKTLAEISRRYLAKLNPFSTVEIVQELDKKEEVLKEVEVLYISRIIGGYEYTSELNKYCRENNITFIVSLCLGPACLHFNDFGDKYYSKDLTGKIPEEYNVKQIIRGNPSVIFYENKKSFKFRNKVKFLNIPMIENKEFIVENDSGYGKLYINGNGIDFPENTKNIKLIQVIEGKSFEFKNLNESFILPKFDEIDESNTRREFIIQFYKSLLMLIDLIEAIPSKEDFYEMKHFDSFLLIFQTNCDVFKQKNFYEIEERNHISEISLLFKNCMLNLAPFTTFLGGLSAQESVKRYNKLTPIHQWFIFENLSYSNNNSTSKLIPKCRYYDHILFFGKEFQEKLSKLKY
jgi:hypothetical protein